MKKGLFILILLYSNILFSQNWSTFYINSKKIEKFAISEYADEFSIFDGDKIKIVKAGKITPFKNIEYSIDGLEQSFSVDYSEVISLLYKDDVLHVGTLDSNLTIFENSQFKGGLPFMLIKNAGIYYGDYIASFSFYDWMMFGEVDVEDGTFDIYGKSGSFSFEDYDIKDISLGEIAGCIDAKTNSIINITQGLSELNVNAFDFNLLPFDEFKELEGVNHIGNGSKRKYNLWTITNNGLALYSSDNHYGDFENWKESGWIVFDKQNSWLKSKNLFGLQKIFTRSYPLRNNFIVFSNEPYPTVYYFDALGNNICTYDYTNSPMSKYNKISSVSQDSEYGVYISQGKKILKLQLDSEMNCNYAATTNIGKSNYNIVLYPNPSNSFINIISEYKIKKIKIYSIEGRLLSMNRSTNYINTKDLQKGIYLIEIELEIGEKIFKKIEII